MKQTFPEVAGRKISPLASDLEKETHKEIQPRPTQRFHSTTTTMASATVTSRSIYFTEMRLHADAAPKLPVELHEVAAAGDPATLN
jgi:hypothetical protein